jgi:hypothetical protein
MPTLYPTTDAEVYINQGSDGTFLAITSDPPSPSVMTYQMVSGSDADANIQISKQDGYFGMTYNYVVRRYIVEFDTSGISRTPAIANLQLYGGDSSNDADIICVETTLQSTGSIVGDDFIGHNETNPVAYTETVAGSNFNSGYNTINFINSGLSAMETLDKLQMTCMEKTYDYDRTEPSLYTDVKSDIIQDTDDGSADIIQPKLSYTMGETYKISSGKVNILGGKVTIK